MNMSETDRRAKNAPPEIRAGKVLNHTLTLALIAHDRKKDELADFVLEHRSFFSRYRLVATAGTGATLQRRTGLKVSLLEHGPRGGDRQLGELAEDHEVQAVIFFRDPVSVGPHEPDFSGLLRVCDEQQIPLATNAATAEALLYFLQSSPNRGVIMARPWAYVQADEQPAEAETLALAWAR
jgi:methylglyoxal synthase